MFTDEFTGAAAAAGAKAGLWKRNPVGYFVASMLAGAFVGFGVLLAFTLGGLMNGQPYAKLVVGAAFSAALSLVIMAGGELFTGNNFVMTAGCLSHTVKVGETAVVWLVCWLGNLAGAVVLSLLYWGTDLCSGAVAEYMGSLAAAKTAAGPVELLLRGVLCNILVCLAVWCGFRCKSESGKLIMVFWCILAFMVPGFEHCVANMTLLTVGLLPPCAGSVSFGGWVYNLLLVTLGNMVGGILFTAVPYYLISRKK